jgi:pimeloyl-ACP methyl ester carboxylesterase
MRHYPQCVTCTPHWRISIRRRLWNSGSPLTLKVRPRAVRVSGSERASDSRQRAGGRQRLEFLFLHSSLREDLRTAVDVPDARLKTLNVPTLCLYGRHSDCAAAGKRLASLLPRSTLRWLDCGHFIPTQAPTAMTEQLLSYFAPDMIEVKDDAIHHVCG